MAEIDNAIREMNAVLLNRAAHSLKGSVDNFGARRAFDLALRLEMMGKDRELTKAGGSFQLPGKGDGTPEKGLGIIIGGRRWMNLPAV